MSLEAKDIEQHIEQIRDERREGANTAKRVGSTMMEIFKYVASAVESAAWNIAKGFLRKDQDDETTHELTMGAAEVKGETKLDGGVSFGDGTYSISKEGVGLLAGLVAEYLQSKDFTAGTDKGFDGSGYGVTKDAAGKYTMELDNLIVRMKMIVAQLEVHEMSFIGGTVVLSPCGNRMSVVEPLDADGNIITDTTGTTPDRYRCYFLATDGDLSVSNKWAVGQLARCQTNNITAPGKYTDYENRKYWRLVVGMSKEPAEKGGKTYHWIDLSNSTSKNITLTDAGGTVHIVTIGGVSDTMNSAPKENDSVVGIGHQWDTERQDVAIITAGGWAVYKDINHYDLPRANIVNKFGIDEVLVSSDHYILRPYAQPDDEQTALCYRGVYDDTKYYGHNDIVSLDGQTWIASGVERGKSIQGKKPSADTPYWTVWVAKGTDGTELISLVLELTSGTYSWRDGQGKVATIAAYAMRGNYDITDAQDASQFVWTRESADTQGDEDWNGNHTTGRKTLDVSDTDMNGTWTSFVCTLHKATGEAVEAKKLDFKL